MFTGLKDRLSVLFLSACCWLVYVTLLPHVHTMVQRAFYDELILQQAFLLEEPRIVIVDVDEASLARVGPWPWSRETMAKLVKTLTNHYQVAVLGVDMVFPNARPGDSALQAALSHPRVVVGQTFAFASGAAPSAGQLQDTFEQPAHLKLPALQASHYVANTPNILTPSTQVGHITPVIDEDGKVRDVMPVICHEQACSLALAWRMWQALHEGGAPSYVAQSGGGGFWQWAGQAQILPIDKKGGMHIPYRVAPNGFQHVAAHEILNQDLSPAVLSQRIVLLGSSAMGLGDRVATPMEGIAPGVEVHAHILSAAMDQALLTEAPDYVVLILLVLLLCSFWVWPNRRALGWLIWLGLLWVFLYLVSQALLRHHVLLVAVDDLVLCSFFMVVCTFLLESNRFYARWHRLLSGLGYLLPQSVVQDLSRQSPVQAQSETRPITVLVADMRGFTRACEGRSAADSAQLAQQCLAAMSEVVSRYHGTIEKYTGDGLMAIWGVADDDRAHGHLAVEAALAMRVAIDQLGPWFTAHGYPILKVSVGVNTGEAAVGLYGGGHHFAWTAQGDAVNLASRIETLTRELGHDLLLGESTAQLWGLDRCQSLGRYAVKGRVEGVEVFTLLPKTVI